MDNNKIIILVGASGTGKSTVGKRLEEIGIKQLVSFTTRKKREGERDGVDYYYMADKSHFKELLNDGEVAEHSTYDGNVYGLLKTEVSSSLSKGDVYFISNDDGASQLVEMYPDKTLVFWFDIDIKTMIERMRNRGDKAENILSRVEHAISTNELEPKDDSWIILNRGTSVLDNLGLINYYLKKSKMEALR